MQPLFLRGDVFQMRDNSHWEVFNCEYVEVCQEYMYEYKNLETGEVDAAMENDLDKMGIVVKLAELFPKKHECKIYNMDDYRKKKIEKFSNHG